MASAERETKSPDRIPMEDVRTVFDYWVATCRNSGKGRAPVLTDTRIRVIKKALRDYPVDYLQDAILGVTKSDFHMGNNSRNTVYDQLELILRNAEKIEKFASLVEVGEAFLDSGADRVDF